MLKARGQAEGYAKDLPVEHGWPPFLVVVDVGYCFEIYADFSLSGKNYSPYPDAQSFRISLDELKRGEARELLRRLWLDPLALDPSRRTTEVTREIADSLARLAKTLEAKGHNAQSVAEFLMRCLFTMFAEDVKLIPENSFTKVLKEYKGEAGKFHRMATALWQTMNKGGFSPTLREDVLKFNGGLFARADAIELDEDQLDLLIEAAEADWRDVEPAIFGTLLERALEPSERHKLGAHFTPRAYVERLVLPTIIEPLRDDWNSVKAAAVALTEQGDEKEALKTVKAFHDRLCEITVLDPACGTGNFLYVAMEHMKRLEGEVVDLVQELGEDQHFLGLDRHTVDPHQFLGIEINPRAAAIAELVLWIGYLQWHFRTRGQAMPSEPVLRNFKNIECRDAVLEWDKKELVRDEKGKPVTRWDGHTTKPHPVTGKPVPDEAFQIETYTYSNPRPAKWPKADFIVGNPPFVGNKRQRKALGTGYIDALRAAYRGLPGTIDFVVYWWAVAADLTARGLSRRFGLITTNSLGQTQNRGPLSEASERGVNLVMGIPDHPWVDTVDGADVRVSMTVGSIGGSVGRLLSVISEGQTTDGTAHIRFQERVGKINSNLSVGPDVTSCAKLESNKEMSFQGPILVGEGFRVSPRELSGLSLKEARLPPVVRRYIIARDVTGASEKRYVIDFFGLSDTDAAKKYPKLFQKLLDDVKPFRDTVNRKNHRDNWWIFGEARPGMRKAIQDLNRYIIVPETSTHKPFMFHDARTLPDHKLYAIASDDAYFLGILSSRCHWIWAIASGGNLGVGNDPTWTNTTCFLPFPFPDPADDQRVRIRELGEALDAHRKARQAEHPDLTITQIYNVLEELKSGEALGDKDKNIHEKGLVSVLKDIHERLDEAVFEAYGWPKDLSDEEILERLVALNHERAKEEKRGEIRWLRPEFQAPEETRAVQAEMDMGDAPKPKAGKGKVTKARWPKALPERVQAVRDVLRTADGAMTAADVAKHFKSARKDKIEEVLATLASLGQARKKGERYSA
jgi:hypothetical protein